jgi:membrane associated rhomboid family serine protease
MAFDRQGGGGRGTMGFWRLTPAVKWLLIANVAIYVVELVVTNWLKLEAMLEHLALTPSRVIPGLEVWQVFTYMWLHHPRSPGHLILNMFGLWMFGTLLSQRWGTLGFLRFYALTGTLAGVTVLAAGWIFGAQHTMTLGASGAIYAVIIAFGLLYPDLRIYLLGILPMKAKWIVYMVLGGTVITYLARTPGISIAAHVGGMAAAALLLTGWWNPVNLYRSLRRLWLRRRLRVVKRELDDVRRRDDDAGSSGPTLH